MLTSNALKFFLYIILTLFSNCYAIQEDLHTSIITSTTEHILNATTQSGAPQSNTSVSDPVVTDNSTILDYEMTPPPGTNVTDEEDHQYYNSTLIIDPEIGKLYWVDLDSLPGVVVHDMLSSSYRRAASVNLTFDFPFYGHHLKNVTVATGGFLYMGVYMHTWLAATQYVAPLMGNFDTTMNNHSQIRYYDNGTVFIVEWKDVVLRDIPKAGEFTFQVSLFKNGSIKFAYKKVPIPINEINNLSHPVKVGLADAYTVDKVLYFVKRKTIYEYHKISLKRDELTNNTAILFTASFTCNQIKDCHTCNTVEISFDCGWCEAAQRCSDGVDRHRQDWVERGCTVVSTESCPATTTVNTTITPEIVPTTNAISNSSTSTTSTETLSTSSTESDEHIDNALPHIAEVIPDNNLSSGGIVAIILIVVVIAMVISIIFYAYRNPQSDAGQFLIRYRPSQWRTPRGQARYTAASIHM